MIRFAREADRAAVFAIWKACFGDPDAYIDFFLRGLYDPSRCLVSETGGQTAAMLHLLPAVYREGGEAYPVQYVYAAATLPVFQRRGLMAGLLAGAAEHGARIGCRFTCLLPAGKALYDYYANGGYRTAFHLRRVPFTGAQLAREAGVQEAARKISVLSAADADSLFRLREDRFNPAVLWGPSAFAYVLEEWRFTGGDVLGVAGGYAFCRKTENGLFVKELCVEPGREKAAAAALARRYGCERVWVHLAADGSPAFDKEEILPGGMLRPVCGDAAASSYFNLMLD